jgi:hypothetical protein
MAGVLCFVDLPHLFPERSSRQAEVKRAHDEVRAAEEIKKEMAKLRQQLDNHNTRSREEQPKGKKVGDSIALF